MPTFDSTGGYASARAWPALRPRRLFVLAGLALLAVLPGSLGPLTRQLMAGAYLQVSVFVALVLFGFYLAERRFGLNLGAALGRAGPAQVPLAAFLGMLPGCGGAVMVVAAHAAGQIRFGAVVATLTATMGDGAFLLIATRPDAAAVLLPLSFVVGVLSGWVVDRVNRLDLTPDRAGTCDVATAVGRVRLIDRAYAALLLPGLALGLAELAGAAPEAVLGLPTGWIGLLGAALGLVVWAASPVEALTSPADAPVTRMAEETSLISVWVLAAYLAYEYFATFAGIDLKALFATVAPLVPLIAVAIGFIPGCGPQVLVTTMYINGAIPFAALAGNAISNDGDALFPAIALNPRAALVATVYTTVPALLVAYGLYLLAPGFLD